MSWRSFRHWVPVKISSENVLTTPPNYGKTWPRQLDVIGGEGAVGHTQHLPRRQVLRGAAAGAASSALTGALGAGSSRGDAPRLPAATSGGGLRARPSTSSLRTQRRRRRSPRTRPITQLTGIKSHDRESRADRSGPAGRPITGPTLRVVTGAAATLVFRLAGGGDITLTAEGPQTRRLDTWTSLLPRLKIIRRRVSGRRMVR